MNRITSWFKHGLWEPPSGEVARHDTIPCERPHVHRALPEIISIHRRKRILDFGCGYGPDLLFLAQEGLNIVGVEIQKDFVTHVNVEAGQLGLGVRAHHSDALPLLGKFDVIYSMNSFEHFSDPSAILASMAQSLSLDGVVLLYFSPPWLHPYGAHLHYITGIPWVHLLIPEKILMNWRSRYRSDGATRFEDVTGGMNRMTLRKFEQLVAASPLQFVTREYIPVKGIKAFTSNPMSREFLCAAVRAELCHRQN
jgi:SAM-dependent methyltransferase